MSDDIRDERVTTIIKAVIAALCAPPYHVHRVGADELLTTRHPAKGPLVCLSERPTLRFPRVGYEYKPDLALCDHKLGSLGFLMVVLPDEQQPSEKLSQWLDEAIYVRHLLLTHRTAHTHAVRSVEFCACIPEGDNALKQSVGEQLRKLSRRTPYMHAISVNLSYYDTKTTKDPLTNVEQAFAWLLPRTWRHFNPDNDPAQRQPEDSDEAGVERATLKKGILRGVELNNYRLSGRRHLKLSDTHRVHVVHGHNGSGKSALAEALELATTGKAERLELAASRKFRDDYRSVICNLSGEPARVTLHFDPAGTGAAQHVATVVETGVDQCLASGLDARAFRLNQPLIESLASGNEAQRADTFLRAFFPEARAAFDELAAANAEWERHAQQLSQTTGVPEPSFESAFAQQDSEALTRSFWESLLCPYSEETAEELQQFASEAPAHVKDLLSKLDDPNLSLANANPELQATMTRLDDTLVALKAQLEPHEETLEAVEHLLEKLKHWQVTETASPSQDLRDLIPEWLELTALADLGRCYLTLVDTFRQSEEGGWQPANREAGNLRDAVRAATLEDTKLRALRDCVKDWADRRDHYGKLVETASAATHSEGAEGVSALSHAPHLTDRECRALDQLGLWLFQQAGFGEKVAEAIQTQSVIRYAAGTEFISIGESGWMRHWAEPTQRFLAAARQVLKLDLDQEGGVARLKACEALSKSATRRTAAEQTVTLEFESHVADLIQPLNELLSLFTPARWAYEPTELTHQREADGAHRLRLLFQDGKTRADLRFNTAELNTLTLALFLLCAVKRENPLNALILDDPFQNMDELTTTTVLRGLARVSLIMPKHWQLIILVHGEETLELVRREIACATYLLPWLSPGKDSSNGNGRDASSAQIVHDPLHPPRLPELQDLKGLMEVPGHE